jgi:stearoyl-CoA desaturase (Delta-9 desaturase)
MQKIIPGQWSKRSEFIAAAIISLIHFGPIITPFIGAIYLLQLPYGSLTCALTCALACWGFWYAGNSAKFPLFVSSETHLKFAHRQPGHLPRLAVKRTLVDLMIDYQCGATPREIAQLLQQMLSRLVIRWIGFSLILGWLVSCYLSMGSAFIVFAFLASYTMASIALSLHRDLTHGSYRSPLWVRCITCIGGVLALQGMPSHWVGVHNKHHAHTDSIGDPHSPHVLGETEQDWFSLGWLGKLRQFGHAHVTWLYLHREHAADVIAYLNQLKRQAQDVAIPPDLSPEKVVKLKAAKKYHRETLYLVRTFSNPLVYFGLNTLVLAGPWFIWGWQGFLLVSVFRIFLVNQVTFCVNSVCHLWGDVDTKRSPTSSDRSRNNALVSWFSAGEGNHANHHDMHKSALHGVFPGEWDPAGAFILWLEKNGLATDVVKPDQSIF